MTTAQSPVAISSHVDPAGQSFAERLNGPWHERSLQVFMGIVLAHWAEHLAQAYQVYVLHWPLANARGVLGLWFPWLVRSEALHYGYALVMLVGLWILRSGFVDVGDRDNRAAGGELPGTRRADPARTAGDQGGAAVEVAHETPALARSSRSA